MFKKILVVFLLITSFSYSQHTIKGKMDTDEKFTWVVLYQLQGEKQNYILNTAVTNGGFTMVVSKTAPSGIYRLVYDLKNRLFVDIIYNNEDVSMTFDPKYPNESIEFTMSEENKIYQKYLKKITAPQQKLDSLQVAYFNSTDENERKHIIKTYQKNYNSLTTLQQQFETLSKEKLAKHFIKASTRYNAEKPIEKTIEYLTTIKSHFFDNIDFKNEVLLNSTFINDKINDYIFYLNTSDDEKTLTKLYKEAITTVINKINTNYSLTKDIEEGLLYTFSQQENISMVNYMLNYYIQLPKEFQDTVFVNNIKEQLKTTIGNIASNILWTENGQSQSLHQLNSSSYYLIVFWSSTCGHCLKELPLLEAYLKDKKDIKIIAIGLETEQSKVGWQTEIDKYQNWIHIFGENKWKNKFARDYGVNATPSFYVLDAKKKILAKPDYVADLKMFFEKELGGKK